MVHSKDPEFTGNKFLSSLVTGADGYSTAGHKNQLLSRIDAAKQLVAVAKAAADTSLLRAKSAPRPHEISNPAFVALFEAHQRDREVLFAAMRTLEGARAALGND